MVHIYSKRRNRLLRNQNAKISFDTALMIMMLTIIGLTGIVPTTLQSIAVLGLSVLLGIVGKIYLVYPVMLFYGSVLGLFAGISVYRWFTVIFLGITFIKQRNLYITIKQLLVFTLFVWYCLLVIAPLSIRRSIFAVVDMISVLLLINCYLRQPDKLKKFFLVYVICAFLAYLTGTQIESLQFRELVNGQYVKMLRNMATFEDPNYMGYFYTGAIFAVVSLKMFTPKIRVIIVLALYVILMTALSLSAIVVNVLLWLLYLWITKGLRAKTIFIILLFIILIVASYQYGMLHPETTVGAMAMRTTAKLILAESGEINTVTSGRLGLAQQHLAYFWNQPVYKMVIGMNAASLLHTDLDGNKMAAHNEYVDLLLNVGLIGTAIVLYYLISTFIKALKNYWRDKMDDCSLCRVMVKLVFVLYAFTLTFFGDYRFMLFMLI